MTHENQTANTSLLDLANLQGRAVQYAHKSACEKFTSLDWHVIGNRNYEQFDLMPLVLPTDLW